MSLPQICCVDNRMNLSKIGAEFSTVKPLMWAHGRQVTSIDLSASNTRVHSLKGSRGLRPAALASQTSFREKASEARACYCLKPARL